MTKKEKLIARMFALTEPARENWQDHSVWDVMRGTMTGLLANANPRFDEYKFLLACEYANSKRV